MATTRSDAELRIMQNTDGRWYWEVISAKTVIARGIAETEPEACRQAHDAGRRAKVMDD
jgi:hypothetical protein